MNEFKSSIQTNDSRQQSTIDAYIDDGGAPLQGRFSTVSGQFDS